MSSNRQAPTGLSADVAGQIDILAARFEADTRSGQLILPEQLLDEIVPEGRYELLRRLLLLEIEHRQQKGQTFSRPEAEQRLAHLGSWIPELLASLWPDPAQTLTLQVIAGPLTGQSYRLTGHMTFLVGRGPAGVQLVLDGDPGISRTHFLVEFNSPLARVEDLNSKNGTFVNGEKISRADLKDGDEIRTGKTTFRVQFPPGPLTLTVDDGCPSPPTLPQVSRDLPGYELLDELGRGGMGIVYRACREADRKIVAVKTVLPVIYPNPVTFARFHREIVILQRLTHPHIVQFFDSAESGGVLYFVMEYVEGQSASQLIKLHGPMAADRVVTFGCQLLEALAHAHLQGFIHRDVKPGNLLITQVDGQEVVKLADFGLGRAYQASAMSGLTVSGQPGGTPGFMPPEQVSDFRSARPTADQYSTAATLYYLLTGEMIYESGASKADLLVNILHNEPIPLRQPGIGPALPGRFGPVLCRALARDPRARYPDVLAFRAALQRVL